MTLDEAMNIMVEAAWGDEFTLRRFQDRAFSSGSSPAKYVKALMLDKLIPRSR